MAVCGRCLLCGHKFDGYNTPDVAVRWACADEGEACTRRRERSAKVFGEAYTHAICSSCHDALTDGTIDGALRDLVAMLDARRES